MHSTPPMLEAVPTYPASANGLDTITNEVPFREGRPSRHARTLAFATVAGSFVGMLVGWAVIAAPQRSDLERQRDEAIRQRTSVQSERDDLADEVQSVRTRAATLQLDLEKVTADAGACSVAATAAQPLLADMHDLLDDFTGPKSEVTEADAVHFVGQLRAMDKAASAADVAIQACLAE